MGRIPSWQTAPCFVYYNLTVLRRYRRRKFLVLLSQTTTALHQYIFDSYLKLIFKSYIYILYKNRNLVIIKDQIGWLSGIFVTGWIVSHIDLGSNTKTFWRNKIFFNPEEPRYWHHVLQMFYVDFVKYSIVSLIVSKNPSTVFLSLGGWPVSTLLNWKFLLLTM